MRIGTALGVYMASFGAQSGIERDSCSGFVSCSFCAGKRNRSNEEREGCERLALLEWGEQASGGQIDTREMEKVA